MACALCSWHMMTQPRVWCAQHKHGPSKNAFLKLAVISSLWYMSLAAVTTSLYSNDFRVASHCSGTIAIDLADECCDRCIEVFQGLDKVRTPRFVGEEVACVWDAEFALQSSSHKALDKMAVIAHCRCFVGRRSDEELGQVDFLLTRCTPRQMRPTWHTWQLAPFYARMLLPNQKTRCLLSTTEIWQLYTILSFTV